MYVRKLIILWNNIPLQKNLVHYPRMLTKSFIMEECKKYLLIRLANGRRNIRFFRKWPQSPQSSNIV